MKGLAKWASAELAAYGNYDEWTDAFNPAVMLLRSMAGMGYQAASSLYTQAGETDDEIKLIQANVAAKQKLYDEMMAGVEKLVGAEGTLEDAVAKARGLAGEDGFYKVQDTYDMDEGSAGYGTVTKKGQRIDLSGDDSSVRKALAEVAKSEEYKSGLYNEEGKFIPDVKLEEDRAFAAQGVKKLEEAVVAAEQLARAQALEKLTGELEAEIDSVVNNPEYEAEQTRLYKFQQYQKGNVLAFHTTETAWLPFQDSVKVVTDQGARMNKEAADAIRAHQDAYWAGAGMPNPTKNPAKYRAWVAEKKADMETK